MADFDKIQPDSIKLDDIPAGTGQADDLLLYVDSVTKEIRKTKVQDLQVNPQGDVYSINGKRGNVTLTLDELGGLKKSGGRMTGTLTVPNINVTAGLVNLTNGRLQFDSAGNTRVVSKSKAEFGLYDSGLRLKIKDPDGTYHNVYHSGNKPTLAELGAKPASYVPAWAEITGKPTKFVPENHTHPWADIQGVAPISKLPTGTSSTTVALGNHNHNSDYAPVRHAHDWADINGKPVYATRWPTYSEVGLNAADVPSVSSYLGTTDLNAVVTPGLYFQSANANASSARHYPTQQAGSLLVQKAAGVTQTYTTYGPGYNQVFVRSWYSNSWGRWIQIFTDSTPPTAAQVGAAPASHTHTPAQVGLSNFKNASSAGHGSVSIDGSKGGYAGIRFEDAARTFMVGSSVQGFHTGSTWQWYFNNGVLTAGSVPWSRITGQPSSYSPSSHTHPWNQITGTPIYARRWPTFAEVGGKPSTYTPPVSSASVRGGFKHTWNANTKTLNIITG